MGLGDPPPLFFQPFFFRPYTGSQKLKSLIFFRAIYRISGRPGSWQPKIDATSEKQAPHPHVQAVCSGASGAVSADNLGRLCRRIRDNL